MLTRDIKPVRRRRSATRRALAPLELVLALPILLAVLALIVNYGIVAAWKVRALTVARHELWSHRTLRTGDHQPRVAYWQASGTEHGLDVGQLPELDVDALHGHDQVARGPLPGAQVKFQGEGGNPDLLDPSRGFASGRASLSRRMPLWGKWQMFAFETRTFLVEDHWQFRSPYMSWWDDLWHYGLQDNARLRIPVIYRLQQADRKYSEDYVDIVEEILLPAVQEALRPMWADSDDIEFRDHFAAWNGLNYYQFNPRFPTSCDLDEASSVLHVDILCKQIRGDPDAYSSQPWRMANYYRNMYRTIEDLINEELNAEMPPSDERAAYLQGLLPRVTALKDACEQFRNSLPY